MRKVIINADDFGLTDGCNQGIIEAINNGIVTSTTIMMNMPKARNAIKLALDNGIRKIGIHLVLNMGKPLSPPETVSSLINETGSFHRRPEQLLPVMKLAEAEREFRRQIEEFLKSGLELSHFDSHQHIHVHQGIKRIAVSLAKEYGVPLRQFDQKTKEDIIRSGVRTTDWFSAAFYKEGVSMNSLKEIISRSPDGILEIMTHPGYIDDLLMNISSYNVDRQKELSILTDRELKNWIAGQGVELIDYEDVKSVSVGGGSTSQGVDLV